MNAILPNATRHGRALGWLTMAAASVLILGGLWAARQRLAEEALPVGTQQPSDELLPIRELQRTDTSLIGCARQPGDKLMLVGDWQHIGETMPEGEPPQLNEVLPVTALQRLDLASAEIPPGYARICHPDTLKKMGIRQNPDFITRPGDLEAMARLGGLCSFASALGTGAEVRLILNGVYFRESKYLDSFVKFQRSKSRRVCAFTSPGEQGRWLLLVAIDPKLPYSQTEITSIASCLQRYQERLRLEPVFDQLTPPLSPPKEP